MNKREIKTRKHYNERARKIARMKRDKRKGIFVGDYNNYIVFDGSKLIIGGNG